MPITTWSPGAGYAPGALVRPNSITPPFSTVIFDPGLELGGGAWVLDAGVTVTSAVKFEGSNALQLVGGLKEAKAVAAFCKPGQKIKGSAMVAHSAASPALQDIRVFLLWRDIANAMIRYDYGNVVLSSGALRWEESTVEGIAPAGTESVIIGVISSNSVAAYADSFTWDYANPVLHYELIYKATQAMTAQAGVNEPVWPVTVGGTTVDGGVTWTAIVANKVIWQCRSILRSGPLPPNAFGGPGWPTVVGATVQNGTMQLRAVSRRIEDENCPTSGIVALTASKVFVGDRDIIAYSATNEPLDWTTTQDAGFLPFGLQQYGSNPVSAIGVYRGNLVPFNSEAFQMWQADPDPGNMGKIDELPIGSNYHRALSPVSNDLFFLSSQGVRTVGIAGGSTNLQAGDVGMPIDPLIIEAVAQAETDGLEPIATYYPNTGQYWLAFPKADSTTEVFVYTMNRVGQVGAWSRYLFPFEISAFAQLGDKMLVRAGESIIELDDELLVDFEGDEDESEIEATLQWPWLDFGRPGGTKMLHGFDIVGLGAAEIEVGYDQTNLGTFTEPYELPADSLPGQMIAFPLSAPSMSIRLTYTGAWEFNALNLYLDDFGGAP